MAWTEQDIPDQAGRTAVVTGATSGIGEATARALAGAGARVVLAARNPEKVTATRGRILDAHPRAELDDVHLDLSDLGDVRRAAGELRERYEVIDLLINNAGVMATPYRRTDDGFELQFATNHLGHFALDGLLIDRVLAAASGRVVTVSSGAHRSTEIDFDNLHGQRRYRRWQAYGQSKLANLLFTRELQRRLGAAMAPAIAVAAHPGYTATNLQAAGPRMAGNALLERIMSVVNGVVAQDVEVGALPTLYAVTAPTVTGNDYIGPDGRFEARGHPTHVGRSKPARDAGTAERLWQVSEELTGVTWLQLRAHTG